MVGLGYIVKVRRALGIEGTIIKTVAIKGQIRTRPVPPRLGIRILVLSADLDRMVPFNSREMLLPVVTGIRPSDNGVPLDSADKRVSADSKISKVVDGRYSEIFVVLWAGAQRACVDAQCIGIDIIVHSKPLRKPLVAQAAFEYFRRADGPRVVDSCQLSARRRHRVPHVRIGR